MKMSSYLSKHQDKSPILTPPNHEDWAGVDWPAASPADAPTSRVGAPPLLLSCHLRRVDCLRLPLQPHSLMPALAAALAVASRTRSPLALAAAPADTAAPPASARARREKENNRKMRVTYMWAPHIYFYYLY
uniref:Uncharacterized protein n=1 Tax=Oryza sativa subsp. indica TaxID=39946 RepID=A0A1V1H5B7_ORYSI|nr:hypothetical protein [Oryza sativa Indica Group]